MRRQCPIMQSCEYRYILGSIQQPNVLSALKMRVIAILLNTVSICYTYLCV